MNLRYKALLPKIQEIWPLFPAAFYLLGFLVIVSVYLVGLTFSAVHNSETIFPTFQSIHAVFQLPAFKSAFFNTALFVIVGTPLELFTGLLLALVLYRSFVFRTFVRSVLLIPLAVPALVTAILLFILFDFPGGHANDVLLGKYSFFPKLISAPINWRGSQWFALGISLIGKVWRDMPISMLILLSGISAIDVELFDAAKTMGAGWRKQLRLIVIPLIMPAISAVILLRSIEMWKEFIFPFVLAGKYPLLGTLIESLYNNWGNPHQAACVAVVLVICIVGSSLVYMFFIDVLKRLRKV